MQGGRRQVSELIPDLSVVGASAKPSAGRRPPPIRLTVEAVQAGIQALSECRAEAWDDALTAFEVYFRMRNALEPSSEA